ncbi:TetR family transcriptional regulator [Corynebacterium macginleyi]|uniref:TetR/AcrR family transcriptional regulator n=1 Tax=Corynebacterium macginleyi TaxID=38290 RepID=UPI00190A7E45|nr:TetR/AcrR family transcriptional regulator [Corynebacterium macginleyi]MBK4166502.1 TetR family transcriptional regulator [Corynebacterium macginleyi]
MSTEHTEPLRAAEQAEDSDAHGADSTSTDAVVNIAISQFSARGFAETKLDTIAAESGMSKRMIRYHFGDKQGLYLSALSAAAERLRPDEKDLELDSAVPVEGVRKLVDWIFWQYVNHPEAIRMMTWETAQSIVGSSTHPVADFSAVALHLDRLLLLGQDAGAFRPSISTNDIFTIIASLTSYRVTNQAMMDNLLGVDMSSQSNTTGMHRLTVDTVLAFLTANIPDSGHESYLVSSDADEDDEASPQDIYGEA